MKFFSKNLGDFLTATRHLTLTERGAYNDIMDAYYSYEQGPLADIKSLSVLTNARSKNEIRSVKRIASEFFTVVDGRLFQQRIENQIQLYREASEKNRANGSLGGRKPSGEPKPNPVGSFSVSQPLSQIEGNHKPITNNQKKDKKQLAPSEPFDLPDWVPKEPWDDFEAMRKGMKKPLSLVAKRLAVKELDKLRSAGYDPGAVLEQSIMRSYLGLFPISGERPAKPCAVYETAKTRELNEKKDWINALTGQARKPEIIDITPSVGGKTS
jgi:uncharacterized protein YdaU (DUF1376 family)